MIYWLLMNQQCVICLPSFLLHVPCNVCIGSAYFQTVTHLKSGQNRPNFLKIKFAHNAYGIWHLSQTKNIWIFRSWIIHSDEVVQVVCKVCNYLRSLVLRISILIIDKPQTEKFQSRNLIFVLTANFQATFLS